MTETETSSNLLLAVQHLSVSYHPRGGRIQSGPPATERIRAVTDVSFRLHRGERLSLIGQSGSGKSTIANALLGLLPAHATVDSGTGSFRDVDLFARRTEKAWNRIRGGSIAYVPQDPDIALNPVKRMGSQIDETLRLHGGVRDRDELRRRSIALFEQVGLTDPARIHDAFPHQLSGGQRQRALIAIALAGEPEIIIADEPTSGLDVTVQKLVLDLLDDVVRSRSLSVLLITHDLAVASERTDSIVVLHRGDVVENGPTHAVVRSPRDPYTRRLFDVVPSRSSRRLLATSNGRLESSRIEVADRLQPQLIAVENLSKAYATRSARAGTTVTRAVRDISFSIPEHSTYGLVGESGSGKSTVARIIAGIDRPDSGSLTYRGRDALTTSRSGRREFSRSVQYIFQNPYSSLDPKMKVSDIVAEPLEGFRIGSKQERSDRVREALAAVGLEREYLGRKPTELSGGQRQRVAIARAVALRPEMIVLDEPVSALDVSVQAQVLQLLVDLQSAFGLTYLFISHDLGVIRLVADRVGVLHHGALIEEAHVDDVFSNPRHDYTRLLIDSIPSLAGIPEQLTRHSRMGSQT
ncbi:dipeptide ABC transporter ATP-binding protein [Rhodococcoides yunnanense]|uniref:dipeptide ABC transporter ATP-binding protein n=1 Tax=Rhodococcoides yunnanense TaxID=278209 RepID=UPI0009330A79|nr:ABC transporter ATP-binding protein [Rhodococcus yunnanensis]